MGMWKPLKSYLKRKDNVGGTKEININDVHLILNIHKSGELSKDSHLYYDYPIIVLKEKSADSYILLLNWATFIMRKIHGEQTVKAVIREVPDLGEVNKVLRVRIYRGHYIDRLKMLEKRNGISVASISIDSITIPEQFIETPPKRYKIDNAIAEFKEHGYFDKPIVVNANNILVDGYSRYLALKELRHDSIPVSIKLW